MPEEHNARDTGAPAEPGGGTAGAGEPPREAAQGSSPPAAVAGGGADWIWDALLVLTIVLLALVLRVIYVHQLESYPFFAEHQMDARYHHDWARMFAAGDENEFVRGPYFRAPLYPWLLGTVYAMFGPEDPVLPRLFQAGLGALNCALLFLLGRILFGRLAGALAGFAGATYWIFLYYDAELLLPVLLVFLDLLLLLLLVVTRDRKVPWLWLACGAALGLSAIARPNILLFAPFVLLWILWLHRPAWKRIAGYGGLFVAGCLIPVLPVTIRNAVVGDDFALIATQGGVNFYIGNNPGADGMSAVIPGDPTGWWEGFQAQVERAERAAGRKLEPSEVSDWYFGEAWDYISAQPIDWLTLMGKKLAYFWSHWEVSNNQDIRFVTQYFTPIVGWLPLGFWIVAPLGVLGLLLSLGDARRLFPLWGFVLVYMVSVVLFFVTARYRVPVVAVLIVLASYAVVWFGRSVRRGHWLRIVPGALVLGLMGFVVAMRPPRVDTEMVQGHRTVGMHLASQQELERARPYLEEMVDRAARIGFPLTAANWVAVANARTAANDPTGAEEALLRALELDPTFPGVRETLAQGLLNQGRPEEAIDHLKVLIDFFPDRADMYLRLGNAQIDVGAYEEGIENLLAAVQRDGRLANGLVLAADRLMRAGRADDARRLLERGAELLDDPAAVMANKGQLYLRLGTAELQAGRFDAGVDALSRAMQESPEATARALPSAAAGLARAGRFDLALRLLESGLEVVPENVALLNMMVQLLSAAPDPRVRDPQRAVELGQRAVGLTEWEDPHAAFGLAQAYAVAGDFAQALDAAERASAVATEPDLVELRERSDRLAAEMRKALTGMDEGGDAVP